MDVTNIVRTALQEMIVPELNSIKKENAEIKTSLGFINKRLDDVNNHLVDQSRRIDETNKGIDNVRTELTDKIDNVRTELTTRIDETREGLEQRIDTTNNRIDQLTFQVGKIAQEMERIKREESVTSDILTRLRTLEQKTANL